MKKLEEIFQRLGKLEQEVHELRMQCKGPAGPPTYGSGREERTVFAFRIENTRLGIFLSQVVETLRMVAPTPLAGFPPVVAGVIDYRGAVIPLLDPITRLGLGERRPGVDSKIIIVETSGRRMGVVVDEVDGLLEIRKGEFCTRDSMSLEDALVSQSCISGTVRKQEGIVVVLDIPGLLTTDEQRRLTSDLEQRPASGRGGAAETIESDESDEPEKPE